MSDKRAEAAKQKIKQTLQAASHVVSQQKEWAERTRRNWQEGATSKAEAPNQAKVMIRK